MFARPLHTRREFLGTVTGGFGALALGALRQARAAVTIDPINPFLPRAPHFAPQAKAVIFLYMVGAPSSIDTFDYKPELQKLGGKPVPASFREALKNSRHANVFEGCKDELMASPFAFSQHGESGLWVSELFPKLAGRVDDLCFIHSMQAESNNHAPASYQLHTGESIAGKASLGSWITYGLGTENENLPGYVLLFEAGPLGGAGNYSNGYLPAAFQGTRLRGEGTPVLDLLPPAGFADGQRASLDLIRELNLKHRAARPGVAELDARIASYELAYRMQSAALEVGDLEKGKRIAPRGVRPRSRRQAGWEIRAQMFARATAGRARRPLRADLQHVRQGRLGRAFAPREKSSAARAPDRPADRRAPRRSQTARVARRDARGLRERVRSHADDAGRPRAAA